MFDLILDLQKIPLKIMGLGINRKVFNFQQSEGGFTAINSSRNTFFYLLFFGLLSVLILSGFLMLLQGEKMSMDLIIVGFIIQPIFGILGLRKFLWLLRGKEKLKIKKGKLTIEKTGTFWTRKKEFQLDDIKNVRSKYETESFLSQPKKFAENYLEIKELQRILLSFTIGEIEFEHKGNVVRLFNDLTDDEIKTVIENIKNYL